MRQATQRLLKTKKTQNLEADQTGADFIAGSSLAAYVESSDDAIIGKTLDGVITDWNAGAERVYGYSAEEVKGKHVSILVLPDLLDELNRRLEVARSGAVQRYETRCVRKDGKIIRVFLTVSPVKNTTGRTVGTSTIARDITESEERVRSLFNRVRDGVYRSTHEGRFVDVNPALVKMFGYSSTQEMLDIPDIKTALYFSPQERGSHLRDTNQDEVKEYRMRRKDGSEIWVEDQGHYIHDEQGNIVYHEGILRDITERKRMEDRLRKSTQFLESIIENASVWMDVIDVEGNVLIWNKAAESISGYSREETTGHGRVWEWLYPDEKYRKRIADTIPDPWEENEATIRRRDGETRIIAWNERRLVGDNGEVIGGVVIGRDVTEQKRMQDELKRYSEHLEEMVKERAGQLAESEARFREMAELLPEIIFEVNERGEFTFVNPSGLSPLGYTEEDVKSGVNALQVFVKRDRDRVKQNIGRILGGEELGVNEYTVLRKDGSTFPVMVHSAPIIHGKPVGLRGIAVDITERKRLEQELRATKERMEYVIASNPAVIYSGKPLPDLSDWALTYVSKRVSSMLGYSPEDLMSSVEFWREHVHPNDLQANPAIVQELWKKGQLTYEYQFRHKDGSYRWIREEAFVTRDADGKPIEVNGCWTDVTERKRMEEELQTAKKRLEYVISSNPAIIFVAKPLPDLSGYYATYLSHSVVSSLGFESDEFTRGMGNEFWASRLHPDDLASYKAAMPQFWKEGHAIYEYRFRHKDGAYRWLHEETRLIRDADGKPLEVIGYSADVTPMKEMELRLTESERLAGIGEAATMVGHDLRNPLQGIAGAIYLLRNGGLTGEERNEVLELIEKNVEYSDGIVKDLLDYARPFGLARVETTPNAIVTGAIEAIHVPDRIKVQNLSQEHPEISVDPDRMRRAFVNLIENAIDAMPKGGTLTASSKESNDFVEITLSDTGSGMQEGALKDLWKPLQTTKAKGMGMGLAIVKRIIDAHNGKISVRSKLGEGTTFTIQLPKKTTR